MRKQHNSKRYGEAFLNWLADRGLIGTPRLPQHEVPIAPNRRSKRAQQAIALKQAATPARRKHEKRGAPGRSSKGRAPFRG